ncbi:hypothetical protein GWI33_016735 [Rhynchophorus ferrugineus]|uniref:Major facilitator superfamily (MFS) profile domain-containing protein n=1 Tax=Rhynchophorus ferrugineus TaxID=354439 RepID=A0A834M9Z6_RHYFE|nr:hypothetical protein GWI33_016735 [Rhynchophorus ferrugineus]
MAFKFTVEVPLFLAFFGFLLTDNLNTNLMIFRTCYVSLGLDKANCSLLGIVSNETTKELEKVVQPKADIILMTKTCIDSVFGALMCLFVGAWSDRFGRKPVIVINLIGQSVMMWVMTVFAALDNASPWYMLICSVPVILTGGGASFLTVLLAYVSDTSSAENRGLRMGIFEATMAAAVLLGNMSSSYLLKATNYEVVYLVATLSLFLALLYTIFWIPESLQSLETENKIRGFFQTRNITGMFSTTFRQRPGYDRAIILLLWSFLRYNWYSSATNILWITGGFLMVYIIHHRLKIQESPLVTLGFLSLTAAALIQELANVDWLIYLAAVVRFPSSCLTPMVRSMLSKLVDGNEAAKIFAVFSVTSNLLGLVGAPVYVNVYNATVKHNPSLFNFITVGADGFSTLCLFAAILLLRSTRVVSYSTLSENDPSSSTEIHE